MAQLSTSYIMIILSCLNAAMLLYTLLNRHKRSMAPDLLLIFLLMLEWNLSVAMRSMATNTDLAIIFHELKFVGAALLPVLVLVLVIKYIGLGRLVQKKHFAVLSVVPVLTILFSQTNHWHHIFRKSFDILYQPDGAFYIHAYNNYWFFVHSIYSYTLWAVSIFLLIGFFIRKPTQYRLQTGIFIIAIVFPVFTNLIDLTGWVKAYDLSAISFTASMAFLLYGVFFYSAHDFIPLARIKLVDSLLNPIFIYNDKYQLTDANQAAVNLAGTKNEDLYGKSREQIMEILPIRPVQKGSSIYCLVDLADGEEQVFSLESQYVSKANGVIVAYIDVFNDITALESAKRKIEIMAITDSLTGLYNRNFFDDTMCCLDREGRRPVALIIGDVDGLKKVNDTYGHAQGDEIIRKAAAAMKSAVRSGDVVARIGGDEFAILLENISQVDVERIIEKIRMNYRELSSKDIPLSICLGYAISNNAAHSIDEVLRLADEDMYNYKREIYNNG